MKLSDVFLRSRGPVAVVDLGGDAVKVLRLSPGRGRVRIEGASAAPLPDRLHPAGLSPEDSPGMDDALREALASAGVRAGNVGRVLTCLGGPAVRLRQIELPPMPDEQIASALQFEAKKHIPFDMNDVVLDFEVLERGDASKGRTVLLAAAQKEAVRRRAELLTKHGFEPEIVDITPLAEMNFLESRGLAQEEAAVGYLDLGASMFGLSLWRRGGLFLHRYLGVEGRQWTRAIGEARGVPLEAAEDVKQTGQARELLQWLGHSLDQLVQEVRQSISFYGTRGGRQGLGTLYLGGGNALLSGLPEHLSSQLGVPVQLPETRPAGAPALVDARFVAALGLAARAAGNGA